jgi:hypothetical protein
MGRMKPGQGGLMLDYHQIPGRPPGGGMIVTIPGTQSNPADVPRSLVDDPMRP